ncbi:hypothetical protein [Listeria phage 20422-1]|uniref:Uncharacterized protein n=3 Tax=Pecentumvirus LP048 TaxID=2560557 RepID=A0A5C2IBM8_9CAUD|nr:hypothetical protein LP048_028 [Listeria phage LP-048]AHL19701.1 hypothetical protein LP048_028 [Listeria phage LP-048]QEP53024.2 hypothetical protein FK485_0024 [Listeria phage LP-039]QNL31791.1 hypothetical protein HUK29_0024 [Listeria phage LP-Mix_6.1]
MFPSIIKTSRIPTSKVIVRTGTPIAGRLVVIHSIVVAKIATPKRHTRMPITKNKAFKITSPSYVYFITKLV